jgi:hypothetical protein
MAAGLGAFPRYDEKPLQSQLIVDEEEDDERRIAANLVTGNEAPRIARTSRSWLMLSR